MELQQRKENHVLIVALKGRLDAQTAPGMEKDLLESIEKGEKHFLLDLSGLQYISSAGLRSLLVLAKKLKTVTGEILFAGLEGPVAEVFKISGFNSIFKIYPSVSEALDQF